MLEKLVKLAKRDDQFKVVFCTDGRSYRIAIIDFWTNVKVIDFMSTDFDYTVAYVYKKLIDYTNIVLRDTIGERGVVYKSRPPKIDKLFKRYDGEDLEAHHINRLYNEINDLNPNFIME